MTTPIGNDESALKQDDPLLKSLARKVRNWLNRFLQEGNTPAEQSGQAGAARPAESEPQGEVHSDEVHSSIEDAEVLLSLQALFEPAEPPEEWLKLVREGAPELLLPPEEGGTPWRGLRAQANEYSTQRSVVSPSENSLASIPTEEPWMAEVKKIEIEAASSNEPDEQPPSQHSEIPNAPQSSQRFFEKTAGETAFIHPERSEPPKERSVRQDVRRVTPPLQAPPDASRIVTNRAIKEQFPSARHAKSLEVPRRSADSSRIGAIPPHARITSQDAYSDDSRRSDVHEDADSPRAREIPSLTKLPNRSADHPGNSLVTNWIANRARASETPRRVQPISRPMPSGFGSEVDRKRGVPSSPEVRTQSSELIRAMRPTVQTYVPVPVSQGLDERNELKELSIDRFAKLDPNDFKPWPTDSSNDPWPELPSDPSIIARDSAFSTRRLEHQRILDLEQQGGR